MIFINEIYFRWQPGSKEGSEYNKIENKISADFADFVKVKRRWKNICTFEKKCRNLKVISVHKTTEVFGEF